MGSPRGFMNTDFDLTAPAVSYGDGETPVKICFPMPCGKGEQTSLRLTLSIMAVCFLGSMNYQGHNT